MCGEVSTLSRSAYSEKCCLRLPLRSLGLLNDVSSEAESCPTQTGVSRLSWMSNRGTKHVMRTCEHVYTMLSDIVIPSPTWFIKPSLDHHRCSRNMHENGTPYVLDGEAASKVFPLQSADFL